MRTSHMVEEIHRVKNKGRIPNKDIHHLGSNNSSNREKNKNDYQGHRRTQPFEDQMLQFMGDNKRLPDLHE